MPRIRAENIEAHKAMTRRQILDAAYDLLGEIKSADISLAEVAFVAGIGRTTLYEYFRDKDDLIASLVEERLPEVSQDLIDRAPEGDVRQRMSSLATSTARFVISEPVLGTILHRELSRLSAEAQERVRVAHADIAREMVTAYRQGVEEGIFREMAPDIAGRFIQETIMAAAKVLIAAEQPEDRFEEVAAELETFLVRGLET